MQARYQDLVFIVFILKFNIMDLPTISMPIMHNKFHFIILFHTQMSRSRVKEMGFLHKTGAQLTFNHLSPLNDGIIKP
jgi:hypothetical protein